MKDVKLVVCDIDNTLVQKHQPLTERARNAIIEMRNRGILFGLASGRGTQQLKILDEQWGITSDVVIGMNGAELYDKKYELLFCIPLSNHDLKVLLKLGKEVFFRNPCNSKLISSANLYFDNLKDFEQTKEYLDDNLTESFVEYKYPKIKVINKKCNKLDIIKIIQDLGKIDDKSIYTIGDDVNDIKMIERYNGYSLITAKEETKKVASKLYEELNQLIREIDN